MKHWLTEQTKQRLLGLWISGLVLLVLGFLGWQLSNYAPSVKNLNEVHIKADSTGQLPLDGVVLGWAELGQHPGANSAEKTHLKVSHNPTNGWQLQNVAAHKRIDAQTDKIPTRYVRRFALKTGDQLIAKTFTLRVDNADDGRLVLKDVERGVSAEWMGTHLEFSDQRELYDACEQSDWMRRTAGRWRDQLSWGSKDDIRDEKRLFTFGGQVNCTTRWPQEDVEPKSLNFSWMDGRFWVGPGNSSLRLRVKRGAEYFDLNNVPLAVKGDDGEVSRLIIGRTHYELGYGDDYLSLKPIRNLPVSFPKQAETPISETGDSGGRSDGETTTAIDLQQQEEQRLEAMQERGIFPYFSEHNWIGEITVKGVLDKYNLMVALGVTLLFALLTFARKREQHTLSAGIRGIALVVSLALSAGLVLLAYLGTSLGTMLLMAWVTACWATLLQFFNQRLSLNNAIFWCLGLLLAGIGLLLLSQLAAGSGNTRWLGFPYESAFWMSFLGIWAGLLALTPFENILNALMSLLSPERRWRALSRDNFSLPHPAYFILVFGVGLLLVLQAIGGKEEGIFGIQPVELAKLLFVIIMARLLWLWQSLLLVFSGHFQQNKYSIAFKLSLPLLLAMFFASIILVVGVNDNSPLFIIGWLTLAFLWMAFIDPLERWSRMQIGGQGIMTLVILSIIALGIYAYYNPPGHGSTFPQAERIRIWADPTGHPEAASQLLNSLRQVGEGGWFGKGWFGKNDSVMTLPAVQDDFIAAFLLNRFGGLAALVLLTIQAGWLYLLFTMANRLSKAEAYAEIRSAFQLIAYVLYGLACLHLLHWAISWSNVLGWLPIMGQPMTWLSAGNSHMLAIGVSTLLLGLVGSWTLQVLDRD